MVLSLKLQCGDGHVGCVSALSRSLDYTRQYHLEQCENWRDFGTMTLTDRFRISWGGGLGICILTSVSSESEAHKGLGTSALGVLSKRGAWNTLSCIMVQHGIWKGTGRAEERLWLRRYGPLLWCQSYTSLDLEQIPEFLWIQVPPVESGVEMRTMTDIALGTGGLNDSVPVACSARWLPSDCVVTALITIGIKGARPARPTGHGAASNQRSPRSAFRNS